MLALIWELFYMGALVMMASYCLHYFAYKKGLGDENDEIKRLSDKDKANHKVQKGIFTNPLVNKWLDFGGGYYGIVAFVKLILIEFEQLKSFVTGWQGVEQFASGLGFNMLIAFFAEQIQNFVAAIIWPTDYLRAFSIFQCAIFVVVTLLLYEWSKNMAKNSLQKNQDV